MDNVGSTAPYSTLMGYSNVPVGRTIKHESISPLSIQCTKEYYPLFLELPSLNQHLLRTKEGTKVIFKFLNTSATLQKHIPTK
jgi:hypothetical protein